MLQICDFPSANGSAVGDAEKVWPPAAVLVLFSRVSLHIVCSSFVIGTGPTLRVPVPANDSRWQRHTVASEADHAADR